MVITIKVIWINYAYSYYKLNFLFSLDAVEFFD